MTKKPLTDKERIEILQDAVKIARNEIRALKESKRELQIYINEFAKEHFGDTSPKMMITMTDEMRQRFDKIDAKLSSLDTRLYKGNGGEPMMVRLDRLERFQALAMKLFIAALVAIFTLTINMIYGIYK